MRVLLLDGATYLVMTLLASSASHPDRLLWWAVLEAAMARAAVAAASSEGPG